MPTRCPRCGSDTVEDLDDGRAYAECCLLVFQPEPTPRLIDPPPSDGERRKDLA